MHFRFTKLLWHHLELPHSPGKGHIDAPALSFDDSTGRKLQPGPHHIKSQNDMKLRSLLTILLVCLLNAVHAQDGLTSLLARMKRTVERAIPLDANDYSTHKSQYYVLDVRLDSTGKVSHIDLFTNTDASAISMVQNAVNRVLGEQLAAKTKYRRVIIPLAIIFPDDEQPFDLPFLSNALQKTNSTTYFAKDIVIVLSKPMR